MTNDEIARAFLEKDWEIRYRGGNSMCTTPSDLDFIVADAPRVTGSEGSPLRYSIAAWLSVEDGPPEDQLDQSFDLYDAERDVTARGCAVFPPQNGRLSSSSGTVSQSQKHGIASDPLSRWCPRRWSELRPLDPSEASTSQNPFSALMNFPSLGPEQLDLRLGFLDCLRDSLDG